MSRAKPVLHQGPGAFLDAAGPVMSVREEMNSLPIGLCIRMLSRGMRPGDSPFFATCELDSAIAGAVMMTPPHNLILCDGPSWPDEAMACLVDLLLSEGRDVPGVIGPVPLAGRFATCWRGAFGGPGSIHARRSMSLGVYSLSAPADVRMAPGALRKASEEEKDLVLRWNGRFHIDCFGEDAPLESSEAVTEQIRAGEVFLWIDGAPVSMAARSRRTWNGETVSLVYTPPELRGRGYATSCVSSLSRLMLDQGRLFCTLFTDVANPVSNGIYMKIGYERLGDFEEFRFEK
jgi:uncharacterized protein